MNEQTWSMVIGFGVVVGLRLLDWIFPKGYVWTKTKNWSTKEKNNDED